MERQIYLDNNATTKVDPDVVAAMLPYFSEQFGNASSSHRFGSQVAGALRVARRQVQALLGAENEQEIVFTSGGTESDNTAIHSALEAQPQRTEIVTTSVEHPAILSCVAHLVQTRSVKVTYVGVDAHGNLDIEAYRRALGPNTAIASIMWANNETGTIFPVEVLAKYAHEAGALFHTDAVQAVGKVPINLKSTEIDMLSLSAHKLHGPKGMGALYVRKGVAFKPLIRGGRQERGRRAGTENVPGIVGFGQAAEIALARLSEEQSRVRVMRDRLERGVLQQIGRCQVIGDAMHRLPNTSNIAFDCLDSEAILINMERAGIAASSGSACAAGSMEPSHVLRAMKVAPTALQGAIRFSLSRENTDEEIDETLRILPALIAKAQSISPLWQDRYGGSGVMP